MIRPLLALAVLTVAPLTALAHMVYVVPSADGKTLVVVFSDSLDPDEKVTTDKLAGLKLTGRAANGKIVAVECKREAHRFTAAVPAGTKIVSGEVTYGLLSKSEKPTLLVYHPKAVLAGATGDKAIVGESAALEVVPVTEGGKTRFRLLATGKPVAGSEGSVLLPDGTKEKVTTDKDGYTVAFEGSGRFAVWLRHAEAKAGEHDGKKYEEVRHYATLVADITK
jgi:uncharacterized GH25 family protein